MGRELKFRAWDKKQGRFQHGNSNICLTLSGRLMWQFGYNSPDLLSEEECGDYDLQQYTGLKDKTDKEIYEGDIVRARSKYVNVVYEVYWDERSCQFRCCANHNKQYDKTHDLRMWADEVIGNIYESPELLEASHV